MQLINYCQEPESFHHFDHRGCHMTTIFAYFHYVAMIAHSCRGEHRLYEVWCKLNGGGLCSCCSICLQVPPQQAVQRATTMRHMVSEPSSRQNRSWKLCCVFCFPGGAMQTVLFSFFACSEVCTLISIHIHTNIYASVCFSWLDVRNIHIHIYIWPSGPGPPLPPRYGEGSI